MVERQWRHISENLQTNLLPPPEFCVIAIDINKHGRILTFVPAGNNEEKHKALEPLFSSPREADTRERYE